jgi:hypothetical protein
VLRKLRALQGDPPPPPAEARRAQNDVAIAIAEAALAYAIERDPRYLAAAKKYMDAAVSYDVWGYSFNKPNVDLAAGHLLYGLGMGYDLLYNDLTPAEREKYRNKLAKQAQLLADYYKPKPGRSYSYSQNHVFIPIAGLAVAAYALYDEVPNAPQWAALSRAIYDRVLADRNLFVDTEDAYWMTRRLAREEGLLVGVSAGANVDAAVRVAKQLAQEDRPGFIVTVLCDGGGKYLHEEFWSDSY